MGIYITYIFLHDSATVCSNLRMWADHDNGDNYFIYIYIKSNLVSNSYGMPQTLDLEDS